MSAHAPTRIGLLLAWAALVGAETLAQLAMRWSGEATGAIEASLTSLLAAVASPWLWLAVACYLIGFVMWMRILHASDLSHAFPTSAVVFVAVMFSSWAVMHEAIGWRQVLGSAAIVVGILLLGPERESEPTVHRDDADVAACPQPPA